MLEADPYRLTSQQAIAKFTTEEEVVAKANKSEYGLSAALFTSDVTRAHRVAEHLESGQVTINAWGMLAPNMPFGGKQNGPFNSELSCADMCHRSQAERLR